MTVVPMEVLGREMASMMNTILKFAPEPRGSVARELHAVPEIEAVASGTVIPDAIMLGAGSSQDGSSSTPASTPVGKRYRRRCGVDASRTLRTLASVKANPYTDVRLKQAIPPAAAAVSTQVGHEHKN